MEASVRAGRRLQDVSIRWQETRDRWDQRQQHADIRRKRMSCAESLQDFQKTQDWTGQMAMSPSGRFQVIEDSRKREPLITREGLQWRFGWGILIALTFLIAFVLLADVISIGSSGHTIDRLSSRIEMIAQKNDQLSAELSYSSGDISVCTEAVKLNLISANGATTVRLTAPQGANMTFTAAAGNGAGHAPGELLASAVGD